MPSFKHKTNKKIVIDKKKIMTLDSVHRELQSEFNLINSELLPSLISKKNQIMKKLNNHAPIADINEKIELQDSLYDIKEEICKNKKKIKDYYLNNSRFIFDYFENKKEITNGTNKTTILNSFFKVNDKTFDETALTRANDNNVQKFFTNLDQTFININDYVYATDICE